MSKKENLSAICIVCGGGMKACLKNIELSSPLYGDKVIRGTPCLKCEKCDRIIFEPDVSQQITKVLVSGKNKGRFLDYEGSDED